MMDFQIRIRYYDIYVCIELEAFGAKLDEQWIEIEEAEDFACQLDSIKDEILDCAEKAKHLRWIKENPNKEKVHSPYY